MENSSGRRLLDPLSPSTRQRITVLTKPDPMPQLCTAPCQQIASYKVIPIKDVKRSSFERLSTLRTAPKIVLKSICCRSCSHISSSKTHRRVLLRAPGNWCKKRRQGTPTCNPKLFSVRTLMRSIESVVEKEELQF